MFDARLTNPCVLLSKIGAFTNHILLCCIFLCCLCCVVLCWVAVGCVGCFFGHDVAKKLKCSKVLGVMF